jgi:DNA-binding HxlR family transcriptional regulator
VPRDPDPLQHALSVVGDRWSPAVVAALLDGPRRYGELQEQLAPIAPNVLSARLRRLAQDGLLVARPYSERPLRYAYEATEAARELDGALRLLADWGERHARGFSPAPMDALPDLPGEDDELLFA